MNREPRYNLDTTSVQLIARKHGCSAPKRRQTKALKFLICRVRDQGVGDGKVVIRPEHRQGPRESFERPACAKTFEYLCCTTARMINQIVSGPFPRTGNLPASCAFRTLRPL